MGNQEESSESPSHTSTPTSPTNPSQPTPHNKSILCPRCGYDLRGITQTWNQTGFCPFYGKCCECGFHFQWKQAYRESEHPWLFEYHWRRKPIRSFFTTLWRSAFPWKFWSDLDLFWDTRITPLLIMLFTVLFLILFVCYGLYVWYQYQHQYWWWSNGWSSNFKFTTVLSESLSEMIFSLNQSMILLSSLVWVLAVPAAFLILPQTLNRSKVRFSHLLRITAYSAMLIVPFVIILNTISSYVWFFHNYYDITNDINRIITPAGKPLIWLFRNIFMIHGLSNSDAPGFAVALSIGLLIIPYWWWAISRYLKIESPRIVITAVAVLSGLVAITVTFAMAL